MDTVGLVGREPSGAAYGASKRKKGAEVLLEWSAAIAIANLDQSSPMSSASRYGRTLLYPVEVKGTKEDLRHMYISIPFHYFRVCATILPSPQSSAPRDPRRPHPHSHRIRRTPLPTRRRTLLLHSGGAHLLRATRRRRTLYRRGGLDDAVGGEAVCWCGRAAGFWGFGEGGCGAVGEGGGGEGGYNDCWGGCAGFGDAGVDEGVRCVGLWEE